MNRRTKSKQRARRYANRFQVEPLEDRLLLAFVAEFSAGGLAIDVADGTSVEVTVENDEVLVNGAAPTNLDTPGDPVDATGVTHIAVAAVGDFANTIALGAVTASEFPNLQSARVDAGGGDDSITGTAIGDRLFGGQGNDVINGLAGNDLLVGGYGDDQLNGGEGNDLLDGAGQISVTVTNLAPDEGTLLTPVFLATADGVYDFFNPSSTASASLERLAEDGAASARISAALGTGRVAQAITTSGGPLQPGDARSILLNASALDSLAQYLSYASMVIPSNDAFIGNDNPRQINLFDDVGGLITRLGRSAIVVAGDEVWDAGTEQNDEIPENTAALAQAAPDTGVDENGVIRPHQGFQGSLNLGGSIGNVLSAIPNGDFTQPGYEVLSIEITSDDGEDTLSGGGGDDRLLGGAGDDNLVGGAGNDELRGGAGNDTLEGDGRIAITLTNLAPSQGTLLTPVFLATADGVYDFFDVGGAASASLESLAEDGNASARISEALGTGRVGAALATPGGPLQPGDTRTVEFDVSAFNPLTQYLSYASMVIPSNDAFIGNDDPQQLALFDADGNLITRSGSGAFVVGGSQVWDAGTEVNDEVPENTAALAQSAPDVGVDEGGVVTLHSGFQGSEAFGGDIGNVLTAIPNGDFTRNGYQVLSIEVSEIAGQDVLIGGPGDDNIHGGGDQDLTIWNNGDGSDTVEGGAGDDEQQVNGDDRRGDRIRIGEAHGRLTIRRTNFVAFRLDISGTETVQVNGSGGRDQITARNLARVADLALLELRGDDGRDRLDARRVGDLDVILDGGDHQDVLFGGNGDDWILGGGGNDLIFAGRGDDHVSGGDGRDRIYGGSGDDLLSGNDGRDFISGGHGNDDISGGDGNDFLLGGSHDDVIRGDGGRDFIFGQAGNDRLFGGYGNDFLFGGRGNDFLRGGPGFDFLFGGPGQDDEDDD